MTKILFDFKFLASVATVMVLSEYTLTIKLIKLLPQVNDHFNKNNKPCKFCLGMLSYWAVYSLFSTYKGSTKQLFLF